MKRLYKIKYEIKGKRFLKKTKEAKTPAEREWRIKLPTMN